MGRLMKKLWILILPLSFIGFSSTVYAMSECCVCLEKKDCLIGTCCKDLHLCFDCDNNLLKQGRPNDFACPICRKVCAFKAHYYSATHIMALLLNHKTLASRKIIKLEYSEGVFFEKNGGFGELLTILSNRYNLSIETIKRYIMATFSIPCSATVMGTLVALRAICSIYRSILSKNRLSYIEQEVASSQKKLLAFDFDMFGSLFVSPLTNRYTVQELSSGIPDEQLRATLAIAIEEYENVYYSIYLKIMSEYYFKPAFDLATKEPELVASLKQKAAQLQSVIDSCKQKVSTRLINWVTAGSGIAISAVAGYGAYRMRRLA